MGAVLSTPVLEASSPPQNDVTSSGGNQHHVGASTAVTAPAAHAAPPPRPATIDGDGDEEKKAPKMSKNKMKRLAKEEKWRALKKVRRAEKKASRAARLAEKRAERAATFAEMSQEERDEVQRKRIASMKEGRSLVRKRREEVRRLMSTCTTYGIAIDLSWSNDMNPKEIRSLARQLSYSYSILRKGVEAGLLPVHLSLVNLDDTMKAELSAAASGWEVWPVTFSSAPLEANDNVIYLTHDSDNVITTLEPECTYVIGGIVDRNRLKGATANKAKELGIRTARFNLDEVISLQKGTRVLTVNHCVDILLQVRNGKSWKDAYMNVLPERKGLSKEEDKQEAQNIDEVANENGAATEMDCRKDEND